jgi:hypothetical protein
MADLYLPIRAETPPGISRLEFLVMRRGVPNAPSLSVVLRQLCRSVKKLSTIVSTITAMPLNGAAFTLK